MLNSRLILTTIIIAGAFLRLYRLNWDEGHYLHPDERLYVNASNLHLPKDLRDFLSKDSPANPKMFYYGSFPLYFYKIIQTAITPTSSFLITSRLISSLLSIATIPVIFLIGQELFSPKIGLLTAFVFVFSPGSIQHAHFNTTESWLVFLLSSIALLSLRALKQKNYRLFIPLGILIGLSYATKIVGLTFALLPLFALILIYLTHGRGSFRQVFFWGIIFLLTAGLAGFLAAPYQIIDFAHFWREQEFMQGITLGKYKPPFVIVYENTLPYLYPLLKILPFTFGFVSLPLAFLGLIIANTHAMVRVPQKGVWIASLVKKFKLLKWLGSWRSRSEPRIKSHSLAQSKASDPFLRAPSQRNRIRVWFIFLFPLLYFLWAGAWYAKFSRYYLLLFPFLSLSTAFALTKLPKKPRFFLLTLIVLNSLLFLRIYLSLHTRVQASVWIYENIKPGAILAGEHWDDNLPLPLPQQSPQQYQLIQLSIYDQPDNEAKITRLAQLLNETDYLVLSSRRVYYSILRNPEKYPLTSHFYQLLLAEKLGFALVKKFTNYPYFVSDDVADESFQSYDHPPVLIFRNEEKLSAQKFKEKIAL